MDTTTELQRWLDLLHADDETARERLIARAVERLRQHASRMLRSWPLVKRSEDTGDVLHGSYLRLDRCLREVKPANVRHFFALATEMIRRELLDLAKKHCRSDAVVARVPHNAPELDGSASECDGPLDTAQWAEFHERVEALPEEEREVFGLLYYERMTQAEAAEVLSVSERTVLRRWHKARLKLREVLADGALG